MAKVAFISLFNKEVLNLAQLSAYIGARGHESATIYLKKYSQVRKNKASKAAASHQEYHEALDSLGRDMVLAYNSAITEKETDLLLELLHRAQPDLIGFTVTTMTLTSAANISKIIKEQFANVPIIWGGIAPTIEPEKCLEYADIVCRGEGEEALLELVEAIDHGRDFRHVSNLWVKENGSITENHIRPLLQDLDSLPLVDPGFDHKYLIEDERVYEGGELMLQLCEGIYETLTARGCPFSCNYCCNEQLRLLYPRQKYVRRRSVDNVMQELRAVKEKRSPHYIYFWDDVFTFNKQWIKEFSTAYKKEIGIPFFAYIHPRFTKEEVLLQLMDAGLFFVVCGIQSGSERVANSIYDRRVSNQDIIKCSRLLNRLGLKHSFDIITNNPLETEDDCRQTLDLLCHLAGPQIGVSKLSIFPGTKMEQMVLAEKPQPADQKTWTFFNKLYLLAQWMPTSLVGSLSNSSFLKKHPELLNVFFAPLLKKQIKSTVKHAIPKQLLLKIKQFSSSKSH